MVSRGNNVRWLLIIVISLPLLGGCNSEWLLELLDDGATVSRGRSSEHKRQPMPRQIPSNLLIDQGFGDIKLGQNSGAVISKLKSDGISESDLERSHGISYITIGQDDGQASVDLVVPENVSKRLSVTSLETNKRGNQFVFRKDRLIYLKTSFFYKSGSKISDLISMYEKRYKPLLRNYNDKGSSIGKVWRQGFVKYYEDSISGLVLSVQMGAIGTSGAGSVPRGFRANIITYDLAAIRSIIEASR